MLVFMAFLIIASIPTGRYFRISSDGLVGADQALVSPVLHFGSAAQPRLDHKSDPSCVIPASLRVKSGKAHSVPTKLRVLIGDTRTGRSHSFAGQLAGLLHPVCHLRLVELVVLMDVEVAPFLALAGARRDGSQRRAAEETHFDVVLEGMDAEEPALGLDAVEGRIPFDRLAHAGDGARDERVEAAPDVAFLAGHGRDVSLHGGVAVALRDLRIAAREEHRFRGFARLRLRRRLHRHPPGGGLHRDLRRLPGRLARHCVHSCPAVRRALPRLAAYGSTNMYRPVSMSKPSGNSGKKYTQEAGSFPTPKVMKMTATTAVKTIESQRWICRNHL